MSSCTASSAAVVAGANSIPLTGFAVDGKYSCTFYVTDAAGNPSLSASAYFWLDFNPPKLGSVTADPTGGASATLTLDLTTITDETTGSGTGASAYYIKDNTDNTTATQVPSSSVTWTDLSVTDGGDLDGISYTLTDRSVSTTDNQTNIIAVFLKDKAGNVSDAYTTTYTLGADSTAPAITSVTIADAGTGTDNATYTDNETVNLLIASTDGGSGITYVIATDNSTIAAEIDNGTRNYDNVSAISAASGTMLFSSISDNTTHVTASGYKFSSTSDGSKQLWAFTVDGAKNISDNATDSIILDGTHPTASISTEMIGNLDNLTALDNTSYTDNRTVTFVLDYNDNSTAQYYVSESSSAPNAYADDIIGGIANGMPWPSSGELSGDNVTELNTNSVDNLTTTVWSLLDNGTDDNATSSYSVTDNYTGDNQTITFELSAGDGLKTLYVWVKDQANNISVVASDNITVDTTGPVGTSGNLKFVDNASAASPVVLTYATSLAVQIDNSSALFSDSLDVYRLLFTDNATLTPDNVSHFDRIPNGNADNFTTYDFSQGTGSYCNWRQSDSLRLGCRQHEQLYQ